jgi:subtilase family serine protease
MENTQANEETGYARLNVNASCCELPCEPEPTPQPDLVVSDKREGFENGEVIVHYRVTNIGDAMAASRDVGVDVNGYRRDTEEVPALGPGASYDGTFTLDCTPVRP